MKPMHERPLVYVAGPYTRPDPVENTRLALDAGEELTDSGLVTAFVPHLTLLWHLVHPHADVEYWYEFDLTILRRADVLYRMPGASTGADREVAFAESLDIPVFYDIASVLRWAEHDA